MSQDDIKKHELEWLKARDERLGEPTYSMEINGTLIRAYSQEDLDTLWNQSDNREASARLEKFSEAVRGANRMRTRAFEMTTPEEPENWWEDIHRAELPQCSCNKVHWRKKLEQAANEGRNIQPDATDDQAATIEAWALAEENDEVM